MEPDELLFYKIDDYLRDRLSPGERASFESELATDPVLAALVRRQRQENQALEVLAERDLRVRMNTWERQLQPPAAAPATLAPAGGRYRLRQISWAAAAMLVLAAGWWLLQRTDPVDTPVAVQPDTTIDSPAAKPKPNTTPARPERRPTTTPRPKQDDIAAAPPRPTPTPKPAPPAPTQRTVDYATLADEYYRERDFFPDGKSGGSGLKIKEVLAHSLLRSRKYDAAVTAFREIANSGKQPYAERAEWALALAYLHQMPRRESALNQVLNRITAQPGHRFYGKAKALQGRLKR